MSRSVGEHVRCPEGTLINGRFKVMREIGCGNFAKVYKCTDVQHPSSTPVAVKILKKEYAADAAFEADILKALNAKDSRGHKVVRMLDQFTWSRCPCFVFGLRGAALRSRKFGVARGHVSMDEIRAFTKEMMVTLAFLHHDVRMVHTDLKPENILIDDEVLPSASNGIGTGWTIADFGSASFYNPAKPDSDLISTRPYRAPEVVLGMPWSTKADVFSMGCIIFELYYGARLFEVNEDAEHLGLFEKRIAKLPLNFTRTSKNFRRFFDADGKLLRAGASSGFNSARPSAVGGAAAAAAGSGARHLNEIVGDESLRDLLMAMLEIDPTRRISAQDCLRHDFLTGGMSSRAVSPLRAQMERMSLGAADTLQQPKVAPRVAAPAPSTAAYLAPRSSSTAAAAYEKENAPSSYAAGLAAKQSAKISPPVPSFGGAMPSAADRGYLPASARAGPGGLGEARNANSGAYAAAYHHHQPTSARDMPAAGKPSAAYTPRYAFGGWQ